MRPMSLTRVFQQFRSDERGVISIELILVLPILTWVLMSTFVYFDLFRNESNTHRAALTVADMFSREQTLIDGGYVTGARNVLRELTLDDPDPALRVTVYRYQASDDTYRVVWSENNGLAPNLDDDALKLLQDAQRLPILADDGRHILVETRATYTPPFRTGISLIARRGTDSEVRLFEGSQIGGFTFDTFTVISPRFTPSLCWDAPAPNDDLC